MDYVILGKYNDNFSLKILNIWLGHSKLPITRGT